MIIARDPSVIAVSLAFDVTDERISAISRLSSRISLALIASSSLFVNIASSLVRVNDLGGTAFGLDSEVAT